MSTAHFHFQMVKVYFFTMMKEMTSLEYFFQFCKAK